MTGYEAIHKYTPVYELQKVLYTLICMREQEVTYLFSAKGPEAKRKMAQLIGYARLMGGISIRRVEQEEAEVPATAVEAAATLLSVFLSMPGPYREKWSERIGKRHDSPINQGAVTRVINEWCARERPNVEPASRGMLVRVNRALTGHTLTLETLDLFINSFGFDKDHAQQLRTTLDPTILGQTELPSEND